MDYAILDELMEQAYKINEERVLKLLEPYPVKCQALTETFTGSSKNIKQYIITNFGQSITATPVDLLITIAEYTAVPTDGGFPQKKIETSITPLYLYQEGAADTSDEMPEVEDHKIEFIRQKRALPKKPYGLKLEDDKAWMAYKWTINSIAEELHISNRVVARICRIRKW